MSVNKPRRTTFKQMLRAAKEAAKVLNSKWNIGEALIRLPVPTEEFYDYCPLTAAAYVLTGLKFSPHDWEYAAEAIGYIGKPHKVVSAADMFGSTRTLPPRIRWMRSQMRKELR